MWEESDHESDDDFIDVRTALSSDSAPIMPVFPAKSKEDKSAQSLLRWIVGFVFVLQAKHHIPSAAVDLLVKFIYALLCVLSSFSPFVNTLRKLFPPSLYIMRRRYLQDCSFSKYPICPKCSMMYYSPDECVQVLGSQKLSKRCSYVAFPNHPQRSRRTNCQTLLLKTVQFISGRKVLYPFKIYCYNGIRATLQKLLLRPQFYSTCQLWRRKTSNHVMSDIYDARIWKEFVGSGFLIAPYTFGLILNVDWFQPYTHTVCSIGVLYLTIMNLPRSVRYKVENIIIVGILPGPSEPSHDINSLIP